MGKKDIPKSFKIVPFPTVRSKDSSKLPGNENKKSGEGINRDSAHVFSQGVLLSTVAPLTEAVEGKQKKIEKIVYPKKSTLSPKRTKLPLVSGEANLLAT